MRALAGDGHLASANLVEDALVGASAIDEGAVEDEVAAVLPAVAHLPRVVAAYTVGIAEVVHGFVEHSLACQPANGEGLGHIAHQASLGNAQCPLGHPSRHVEWQPDVLVGVFDSALKLRPVAGDAHAAHRVAWHDGQRAATCQLVGICRIMSIG